jgi:hypothetical protein
MKEIYPNLHIGSQDDYENIVKYQEGWFIIQACKEPYHRKALGYIGRSAPKDNAEYLICLRGNHLILNLIDADSQEYIPKIIIDKIIETIDKNISLYKIFVHCNQGMSRSATIGLLYLHHRHILSDDFLKAEMEYKEIYPWYMPKKGIRDFAINNWREY